MLTKAVFQAQLLWLILRFREQVRSHSGSGWSWSLGLAVKPVGVGLLSKVVCQATATLADLALSRASPLPRWIGVVMEFGAGGETWWEWACSRRRCVRQQQRWLILRFREQARSHGGSGWSWSLGLAVKLVGVGLLTKAVCQAAATLADPALSRASPLPRWIGVVMEFGAGGETGGSGLAHEGGVSGNSNVG